MTGVRRIAYRVQQFFLHLISAVLPWQAPDLSAYLTEAQLELFGRMSHADQRHCLAVWRALRRDVVTDEALLQAALLHDVGKATAGVMIWHRVIGVLLEAVAPRALAALGKDRPGSWRYPFYLYQGHAERGANMAQQAGVLPAAVDLIRWHHNPDVSPSSPELLWRLRALQSADEAH